MAGVAVSVALLVWAARGLDLRTVLDQIREIPAGPVLWCVVVATLVFPLRMVRWRILLRGPEGGPLAPRAAWDGIAIGYMANNVLPFRAGELLRSYAGARLGGVPVSSALASVAVERAFDALTVVGLLVVALFTADLPDGVRIAGLGIEALARRVALAAGAGFLAAAWFLARPDVLLRLVRRLVPFPGIADRMVRVIEGVRNGLLALRSPARLAAVVGWSLVIWLVNAWSFHLLFPAFGIELGFSGALLVQAAIVFGIAVPSSPGFVGVFEVAIVVSLGLYAVAQDRAFAYAVTYHLTTFFPITLLGAVALARAPSGWRQVMGSSGASP